MRRKSRTQAILRYLERGNTITGLKAWRLFGVYRLSGAIEKLRKQGNKIHMELIRDKEKGIVYGEYRLIK